MIDSEYTDFSIKKRWGMDNEFKERLLKSKKGFDSEFREWSLTIEYNILLSDIYMLTAVDI